MSQSGNWVQPGTVPVCLLQQEEPKGLCLEICDELLLGTTGNEAAQASMEAEVTRCHGEPYAGKLHVRFDEGAGVPHGASRSTLHPLDP